MKKGKFIVIDGCDGAGKSSLVKYLSTQFPGSLTTFEPGATPFGKRVRELVLDPDFNLSPLTQALLINADRVEHLSDVILPALDEGRHVFCDRFIDSTYAYQSYGNTSYSDLYNLHKITVPSPLQPDLYLILDVTYEVANKRLRDRGNDMNKFDNASIEEHKRRRKMFLKLALESFTSHRLIDGTLPQEQVFAKALEYINE